MPEVELAEFLHESSMSQATIDQFMKLKYVGFLSLYSLKIY